MTVKYVQIRDTSDQRAAVQELSLGGVRVRILARWVAALDRWVAALHEQDDTPIVAGIVCVPGVDLLRPYKHLDLPQGQLFCSAADREPPTFTTLDQSARVLYRE